MKELRALIHSGDPQRYHEINEAFHGVVYTGAHNDHLAEMTLSTTPSRLALSPRAVSQLGSARQIPCRARPRGVAMLRGDRAGAADAMRAHIVTVSENTGPTRRPFRSAP